jgi:hypothetical protein
VHSLARGCRRGLASYGHERCDTGAHSNECYGSNAEVIKFLDHLRYAVIPKDSHDVTLDEYPRGMTIIDETVLQAFCDATSVRVITPGATARESLHVLSALERRSSRWDTDPESTRSALSAAVSLVLRLLGREADPAKSREHVLMSVLAELRLAAGGNADIASLMQDLTKPPIAQIGALSVNTYLKKRERRGSSPTPLRRGSSPTPLRRGSSRAGDGGDAGECA